MSKNYEDKIDAARLKICAILRAEIGHDFSGYRDKTFLRRVQRRMQVIGTATLDDYAARLQTDHEESILLFRDLLICVTSFFRDKETFETLEALAIPHLFAGKQAGSAVRAWVPGCATGGLVTVGSYLDAQDLIVFVRDNGITPVRAQPCSSKYPPTKCTSHLQAHRPTPGLWGPPCLSA